MYEYDHVSAPATNPADLTSQLNTKNADGWEVVTIYTWDKAVVAIIKRTRRGNSPSQYLATTTTQVTDVVTAPAASAPANWYPDPSGRFELRYWNGDKWTEHVSTGGQQSTDAPVK